MSERHALLVGATGLVGQYVLLQLLADRHWSRVTALTRRPLAQRHPKLVNHVIDFEHLADQRELIQADDLFCCLGTTIKAAGSRAAFEHVDFDYVQILATLAEQAGIPQFLLVSAVGANARSKVFYNHVKGEIEDAVCAMRLRTIHVVRPGLLLGPRREARAGEDLAKKILPPLNPLLLGPLRRYRAVPARVVAQTLLRLARADQPGKYIHHLPVPDPWPVATPDTEA